MTTTAVAMQANITNQGGIFTAVFSSASKYRINPAPEWNPSPFFSCAIGSRSGRAWSCSILGLRSFFILSVPDRESKHLNIVG